MHNLLILTVISVLYLILLKSRVKSFTSLAVCLDNSPHPHLCIDFTNVREPMTNKDLLLAILAKYLGLLLLLFSK